MESDFALTATEGSFKVDALLTNALKLKDVVTAIEYLQWRESVKGVANTLNFPDALTEKVVIDAGRDDDATKAIKNGKLKVQRYIHGVMKAGIMASNEDKMLVGEAKDLVEAIEDLSALHLPKDDVAWKALEAKIRNFFLADYGSPILWISTMTLLGEYYEECANALGKPDPKRWSGTKNLINHFVDMVPNIVGSRGDGIYATECNVASWMMWKQFFIAGKRIGEFSDDRAGMKKFQREVMVHYNKIVTGNESGVPAQNEASLVALPHCLLLVGLDKVPTVTSKKPCAWCLEHRKMSFTNHTEAECRGKLGETSGGKKARRTNKEKGKKNKRDKKNKDKDKDTETLSVMFPMVIEDENSWRFKLEQSALGQFMSFLSFLLTIMFTFLVTLPWDLLWTAVGATIRMATFWFYIAWESNSFRSGR
jgi:hypothetical protein